MNNEIEQIQKVASEAKTQIATLNQTLRELRKKKTQLKKASRNQLTYQKRLDSKIRCDCCEIEIDKYAYDKHLLCNKHIKRMALLTPKP